VQREQEKQARAERIQRQVDALKKLMNEKKYAEVLSRTKELLTEFPGETDFKRLAEFAGTQQANLERELLLRRTLDGAKALFDANKFEEAVRAAQSGLRTFPGNLELVNLAQQAEIQERKLAIRQQIERRIREIRVKINREKFSEAIDLANQTLVTLGPDTDVTQLLNSAQVEFAAREKQREQERKLETIRTLIESGNLQAASQTIEEALETKVLETFDPRVQRLSEQIRDATSVAPEAKPTTPLAPPTLSREYAFFPAAPLPSSLAPPEKPPATEAPTVLASAEQATLAPQPIAPVNPTEIVFSAPSVGQVHEQVPAAGDAKPSDVAPEISPYRIEVQESPTPAAPAAETMPAHPALLPIWRKPVVAAALALGVIAVIWAGIYLIGSRPRGVNTPTTKATPAKPAPPATPKIDPLEAQQRDALNAADKLIAANDLERALQKLRQATSNGPLAPDIKKKMSAIEESMKDANLRQLRQREETLWQEAMNRLAGARYAEAQKGLRQILALPAGGVRREDAQNYLDKVIPQRILQSNLLSQGRESLRRNDFRSARQATDQLKQNGGNPSQLAAEIDEAEQASLAQLEGQFSQLKQRDDDAALQQLKALLPKFQALASDGGPQSSEALNYANNLPAVLTEVQARIQRKRADSEFQQVVQSYQQAAGAADKNGLAAARANFQGIVQRGGPHADEAEKYLAEINSKLAALNQPPVSTPKPPVKPETPAVVVADAEAAIRVAIQRYAQALNQRDADALREIWPTLGSRYARYRSTFEVASSIRMRVDIDKIDLASDGATAVVVGQVTQDYTPKGSKTRSSRDAAVFHLSRVNGSWIITDVQ